MNFSYRGSEYEIDLSAKNAKALDKVMGPYLEVARRVPRKRSTNGRPASKAPGSPNPAEIRAWAASQGIEVSDRGRVSADITRRYQEAQSG